VLVVLLLPLTAAVTSPAMVVAAIATVCALLVAFTVVSVRSPSSASEPAAAHLA
jgi:hypothetical protein